MRVPDLRQLAGRLIIAGFQGLDLAPHIETALGDGGLGGVVLFKRNVASLEQVHGLLGRAVGVAKAPPLLSVDQEGGRVVRLQAPMTELPPARQLGQLNEPETTRRAARLVAEELRGVGFTVNFAPVLDVDTNPDSPVIGDRAFSEDPRVVSVHGVAFARGLREGGITPVAKHFPGHGDAALDSHVSLPTVSHGWARLSEVELLPFTAWSEAGAGAVMSAHVVYPALDPARPATLSAAVLTDLLRGRLGFRGAVFSDDLEMGAMEAFGDIGAVAVAAVEAGVDGLLICSSEEKQSLAREALARQACDQPAFARRLVQAAGRLSELTASSERPPFEWIGSEDHLRRQSALLRDVSRRD